MDYNFNEKQKLLILLSMCEDLTVKQKEDIICNIDLFLPLLYDLSKVKSALKDIVGLKNLEKVEKELSEKDVKSFITNLKSSGIKVLTYYDEIYPEKLKNISNPPYVLYYKGNIDLLNEPMLAVVGTRRATRYGKDITEKFVSEIAYAGITIISGLADGIDSVSHETALKVKGKTIAVLGSGLNHIYPNVNEGLANKMINENGLILTEYLPNEIPQSFHFPYRNRIIAGLCDAMLIPESPIKGGTMITKNYALEFGKNIYAIPGRLTDIYSSGCNLIIKNCQSACVTDPNEIISSFGLKSNLKIQKENVQLSLDEQLILNIIGTDVITFEELLEKSKIEVKSLTTLLMRMELKSLISKLSGNRYQK